MGSKLEDFTDDHRTDLMDPLPQVTQPGRNAKLWQAGTLAATRARNEDDLFFTGM